MKPTIKIGGLVFLTLAAQYLTTRGDPLRLNLQDLAAECQGTSVKFGQNLYALCECLEVGS